MDRGDKEELGWTRRRVDKIYEIFSRIGSETYFLTPRHVSILMDRSRQTIYDMKYDGRLPFPLVQHSKKKWSVHVEAYADFELRLLDGKELVTDRIIQQHQTLYSRVNSQAQNRRATKDLLSEYVGFCRAVTRFNLALKGLLVEL